MKTISYRAFPISTLLFLACAFSVQARPIDFGEVSLLVRAHETPAVILDEVRSRKMLHPLSAAQENTLKAQGAEDGLVRRLREADLTLSPAAAATLTDEDQRSARNRTQAAAQAEGTAGEKVRIFDVAYGHPVSLGQFGGAAGEIAFQLRREAGEDIVEPVFIDSDIVASTYRGQGRPDDGTTIFDRRDYVSVISHDRSRVGAIDTENPVSIKGVPYLLYPVSGTGGVAL